MADGLWLTAPPLIGLCRVRRRKGGRRSYADDVWPLGASVSLWFGRSRRSVAGSWMRNNPQRILEFPALPAFRFVAAWLRRSVAPVAASLRGSGGCVASW